MFCVKCGVELPDGSKFCSSCGSKLSSVNSSNAPTDGMCLFTIERKKSLGGMATKFKIYIDGELVKELSNGESFSKNLKNGKHNLYCDAFGMNRTPSQEFIGNSNEIGYFISFPSTAQALFLVNTTGQTLILNKIKETEHGTYNG